ncbi:MAG: HAD-IA family hydrolase [Spirochaetes bacterium]|nr:HAD-IA family hydrolase [Spirochaetota bacterium]
MNNNKYVYFDFDGTIADTMLIVAEIFNEIHQKYHLPPLTEAIGHQLRENHLLAMIRLLKIKFYQLPFILTDIKTRLNQRIKTIPVFEIKDLIKKLQNQGIKIGILSSNTVKNIDQISKNHQMNDFYEIISVPRLGGKATAIKKLLKKRNIQHNNFIYVGDEVRDIIAAKKANVKIISVTWGYNSKNILSHYQPDAIIENPDDGFEIICQFFNL